MGCSEQDSAIFVGSGSTSASNLLIDKLKIKKISDFVALRERVSRHMPSESLFSFLAESLPTDLDSKRNCERLDWNKFKCSLCDTIVPGLQLYIEHA